MNSSANISIDKPSIDGKASPISFTQDVQTAADKYHERGWTVIRCKPKSKEPWCRGWQNTRLDDEPEFSSDDNISILPGKPSGGLIDVDLDCDEAVELAPLFLPSTGMIHGRGGQRRHYWYKVEDPPQKVRSSFLDPNLEKTDRDNASIVELMSTRSHVVVPPSVHQDTGQEIVWYSFDDGPANVQLADLLRQVARLAAAVLLVRHWKEGHRHNTAMALAGGLCVAGWDDEEIKHLIKSVSETAGDEEVEDRLKAVETTLERYLQAEQLTGWTRLSELIGDDLAGRIRVWFDRQGKGNLGR